MQRLKAILSILIFNLSFISAYAQNTNEVFADALWQEGNHQAALKEYLRCIFFNDGTLSNQIYLKTSELFFITNNLSKGLEHLDLHYYKNFQDQEEKNKVLFKKAQALIQYNKYEDALSHLLQIKSYDAEELDHKWFYTGVVYTLLKNEKQSIESFARLSYVNTAHMPVITTKIQKMIKKANKNPNYSLFLSAVVPGLGQSVNGDIHDGLKSFVLVGGLAALFIDIFLTYSLPDALLSVGPWLTRYYLGGTVNAYKQAERKNKVSLFEGVADLTLYLNHCRSKGH